MNTSPWPDSSPWWALLLLGAGVFIGWCAGASVELGRAQLRADLDRELAAYLDGPAGPPADDNPTP